MKSILTLLFDVYTRNLDTSELKTDSQEARIRFQQLKELAGQEEALNIWDTAVGEGAVMQEVCFQAGMKAGVMLMLELLSL